MKFLVEISARHVHVSQEDLEILFGEGAQLHFTKELSQPGQYACQERVTLVGPKREQKNVIILGPTRPQTQVEVSATDARALGLVAPVRESGKLEGSTGCKLVGPAGEIDLKEGVIVAKRHIHTKPADAQKLGVKDQDVVMVKIESAERTTIFGDVVVRVNEAFETSMHIDTDEGNAAGLGGSGQGEIVSCDC